MALNGEEESTVSLVDVLEEDDELEDIAYAVLGASDPDKCSYPQVGKCASLRPVCTRKSAAIESSGNLDYKALETQSNKPIFVVMNDLLGTIISANVSIQCLFLCLGQ